MEFHEIQDWISNSQRQGQELADYSPSLSYVLESNRPVSVETMNELLREVLGDLRFSCSYLFDGASDNEEAQAYGLDKFFDLEIPDAYPLPVEVSPFEISNHLIDLNFMQLASAEPDYGIDFSPPEVAPLEQEEVVEGEEDHLWAIKAIRAKEAWAYSKKQNRTSRGQGISIGHPDTGYNDHDEIDPAIDVGNGNNYVEAGVDPLDPLDNIRQFSAGHGIGTASVIASRGDSGKMIGAAPASTVVPIRSITSVILALPRSQIAVTKAIYYATVSKCHVISMSLGGSGLKAMKLAIDFAVKDNHMIVLAAAGNHVWPLRNVVWPARYESCIALAGTNARDKGWFGSSRGSKVNFSAPARKVWRAERTQVAQSTKLVTKGSGTSFATALSAGAAALWLAHFDRNTLIGGLQGGETLQGCFLRNVCATVRTPIQWRINKFGAGILNAEALLQNNPFKGSGGGAGAPVNNAPTDGDSYAAQVRSLAAENGNELISAEADKRRPFGMRNNHLERFGLELIWLMFQVSQADDAKQGGLPPISTMLSDRVNQLNNPALNALARRNQ